MKVYNEYDDGWIDLQAIFDSEEKAEEYNKSENGCHGSVDKFELNEPGIEYE